MLSKEYKLFKKNDLDFVKDFGYDCVVWIRI